MEGTNGHLIVLVHGFQGNSFDLRMLRNNIAVAYPNTMFLCSKINEVSSEGDIGVMGHRLATEVTEYVDEYCPGSSL